MKERKHKDTKAQRKISEFGFRIADLREYQIQVGPQIRIPKSEFRNLSLCLCVFVFPLLHLQQVASTVDMEQFARDVIVFDKENNGVDDILRASLTL